MTKKNRRFAYEIALPVVALLTFFGIQSPQILSEAALTAMLVILGMLCLYFWHNRGELMLFMIGLIGGTFVEVVLRIFGTQQHWTDASFYGVPYWLPIAWGFGFIIIVRIGAYIRHLRNCRTPKR